MASLTTTALLDADQLDHRRRPQTTHLVVERPAPDAAPLSTTAGTPAAGASLAAASPATVSFTAAEGPFDRYRRKVTATPEGDRWRVVERTDFRVAAPVWRPLLHFAVRRELRRGRSDGAVPWWAPPDRFDPATARTISLLCVASIITGYLGTLIGQTATFASDEFSMSDRAQGILLAAVRIGTVITLVVSTLADRGGRRRWLLVSIVAGCATTVVGALSTGPWTFGISQSVARGFATAIAVLIGIMAAEYAPRNSRAYVASVLTLTAGLGAGASVWFLPLADLEVWTWRLLYVLPAVGLPLAWWLARHLRESDRFEAHLADPEPTGAEAMLRSRLVLVAVTGFLLLMFSAPASQFRNEFLRDERGFSAAEVSLFVLATNTPVGIGVAIAGKLADRRGRRPVAAFAVFGGSLLLLCQYTFGGWGMWVSSVFASIIGAMAAPSLGVYQAELFGTGRRGRASGIVTLFGLGGSACGLLLVGALAESFGDFSSAFAVMMAAPIAVVALVLLRFPETAHLELEEINPADRHRGPPGTPP